MYKVIVHPRPKKRLLRIHSKDFERITGVLQLLSKDPRPSSAKALASKKLGDYRIRIGDWRVLYDVDDKNQIVFILDIDRRDKAYK